MWHQVPSRLFDSKDVSGFFEAKGQNPKNFINYLGFSLFSFASHTPQLLS
jgi:hypothetical protein